MFDRRSLVSTRETAAILALRTRRDLAWNRIAGAVEEEGSALRLLEQLDAAAAEQLFTLDCDERGPPR